MPIGNHEVGEPVFRDPDILLPISLMQNGRHRILHPNGFLPQDLVPSSFDFGKIQGDHRSIEVRAWLLNLGRGAILTLIR